MMSPHPLQTLADEACLAFARADFRVAMPRFQSLVAHLEHSLAEVPAQVRFGLACSLAACGELKQSVTVIRQVPLESRQRLLSDQETDLALADILRIGWDAHQIQALLCAFALKQGRWEYKVALRTALEAIAGQRAGVPLHRSLVFDAFAFGMHDRLIAALTARFASDHASCDRSIHTGRASPARPQGAIRVAALSGEFRTHPTALLLGEVMAALDRSRIHLTGVYLGSGIDHHTDMVRAACTSWIHMPGQTPKAVARTLSELDVDILWALGTFQQTPVAEVLALRPVPLVINAVASIYPHGTSLVDYSVVDRLTVPPLRRGDWEEAIIEWPSSPLVLGRVLESVGPAPARAALGLPDNALVMAAFHRGYKFSRECAEMWSAILRRCPNTVLWRARLDRQLEAAWQEALRSSGIDPAEREVVAPELPWADHLARLRQADLFLDSTPTGGHTTLLETLAQGVPAVAMAGAGPAGRVGLALLHEVGLGDCIAGTSQDYVDLVTDWAGSPARRERWRTTLEQHLPGRGTKPPTPIFDPIVQARWWEETFATVLARHRAGQAPQDFRIERSSPG